MTLWCEFHANGVATLASHRRPMQCDIADTRYGHARPRSSCDIHSAPPLAGLPGVALDNEYVILRSPRLASCPPDHPCAYHSFERPNTHAPHSACPPDPFNLPWPTLTFVGPLVMNMVQLANSASGRSDRRPATLSLGVRPPTPTWYLLCNGWSSLHSCFRALLALS